MAQTLAAVLLASLTLTFACAAEPPPGKTPTSQPADLRPISFDINGAWAGNGICYGPHRDGQGPNGPQPTKEQIREDLKIMATRWNFIRMYAVGEATEFALQIIREDKLPIRVLLGAWIDSEMQREGDRFFGDVPAARKANAEQVAGVIRLANAYPDIVLAVGVGNESQVFWSAHRTPMSQLIRDIRTVRQAIKQPVTTCDDFNFWNKPESHAVAAEVDFIATHIYAMWAGQPLERAMPFTEEKYNEVQANHPGRLLVITEAGWATQKHNEGEQAKLIKGEAGEPQQKTFYRQYIDWTTREKIANFYFQAFDEKWKGGQHPDEVEKHWGLFNSDRTPKLVLREPK